MTGKRVAEQSRRAQLVADRKKLYRTPTNSQMMRFLVDWALRRAFPARMRPQPQSYWRLLLQAGENVLGLDDPDARGFRWIESPSGHYSCRCFFV